MRYIWFFLSTIRWIITAVAGGAFLLIEARACEMAAEFFFAGNLLINLEPWQPIFFGFMFDLMGIGCLVAFVALGVYAPNQIGREWKEARTRKVPYHPSILTFV